MNLSDFLHRVNLPFEEINDVRPASDPETFYCFNVYQFELIVEVGVLTGKLIVHRHSDPIFKPFIYSHVSEELIQFILNLKEQSYNQLQSEYDPISGIIAI